MSDNRFILWLLGPTSSGKTTISRALLENLRQLGRPIIHYDGDEVRDFFGPEFGFNENNRLRVVQTTAYLANKSYNAGQNVIVSALTAHEDARELVKSTLDNLVIGYVKCSIETCAARDPKGLYAQAERGEIDTLIGVHSEYIEPINPDFVLDSEKFSFDQNVDQVLEYLRRQNYQI